MITIADVEAARERIAPHVRRTPVMPISQTRDDPTQRVSLKLECLQAAGSFKARGAISKLKLLGIGGEAADSAGSSPPPAAITGSLSPAPPMWPAFRPRCSCRAASPPRRWRS